MEWEDNKKKQKKGYGRSFAHKICNGYRVFTSPTQVMSCSLEATFGYFWEDLTLTFPIPNLGSFFTNYRWIRLDIYWRANCWSSRGRDEVGEQRLQPSKKKTCQLSIILTSEDVISHVDNKKNYPSVHQPNKMASIKSMFLSISYCLLLISRIKNIIDGW